MTMKTLHMPVIVMFCLSCWCNEIESLESKAIKYMTETVIYRSNICTIIFFKAFHPIELNNETSQKLGT